MKSPAAIERQKQAWLGDAIILFYVRVWLLEKFPASMLDASRPVMRIIADKTLAKFAKKITLVGRGNSHGGTTFEAHVYKLWLLNPPDAQKLVYELCEFGLQPPSVK